MGYFYVSCLLLLRYLLFHHLFLVHLHILGGRAAASAFSSSSPSSSSAAEAAYYSASSSRSKSACRPPLIVFGASMVDVGENAEAMPLRSIAEFPPYGLDYFRKPAARYSNGRLIIDFISQGLGYGLLDPFLKTVGGNFAHGVNFASSGSTARNTTVSGNGTDSSGLFSLSVQVDQYKRFKAAALQAQAKNKGSLKHLPTAKGLSEAIHFIETAHNDYISTAFRTANFNPLSDVLTTVSAIEAGLLELHTIGANNIIVMNVLPLGCVPGFLGSVTSPQLLQYDTDGCLAPYNNLVNLHNSHLQQLINKLRVELSWKSLVLFDANAIYLDAIRNPSKYGVEYPFKACCGVGGGKYNIGPISCGQTGTINGTRVEAKRCDDPSKYISWDGLHPVETFAKLIANGVLTGQYLQPNFVIADFCMHT